MIILTLIFDLMKVWIYKKDAKKQKYKQKFLT